MHILSKQRREVLGHLSIREFSLEQATSCGAHAIQKTGQYQEIIDISNSYEESWASRPSLSTALLEMRSRQAERETALTS